MADIFPFQPYRYTDAAGPLERLTTSRASFSDEAAVYRKLGLSFIEPELREERRLLDHLDAVDLVEDVERTVRWLHPRSRPGGSSSAAVRGLLSPPGLA